jgi:hypothetical protein
VFIIIPGLMYGSIYICRPRNVMNPIYLYRKYHRIYNILQSTPPPLPQTMSHSPAALSQKNYCLSIFFHRCLIASKMFAASGKFFRFFYIMVDFATAGSQNGVSTFKLALHKKTSRIKKMTKTIICYCCFT